jgi:uncharacterized protein YjbI with pentapeptide repeats/uncharacterized RDD family membrane protein YckC
LAAWGLEVSLLSLSVLIPYTVGSYIETHSQEKRVPLNPVLEKVEQTFSESVALPRRQGKHQVPPLTNMFWWIALASPVVVTTWQLYILGKTGRTLPKRWLGLRVITGEGKNPGLTRVLVREGLGKWGLPALTAYLLWRYSFAFPNVGLLLGLGGLMVVLEGGMGQFSSRRNTFHDRIAGTVVVDGRKTFRKSTPNNNGSSPVFIEVQAPENYSANGNGNEQNFLPGESVSAIVFADYPQEKRFNLWNWMRQHPGTTLLLASLGGITVILGAFVGTQVYIQTKVDLRESQQQKNEAFSRLVEQLNATAPDPMSERKSVILALSRLDDPRAIPLLVDLLGEETEPSLMETLQQAIINIGPKALAALRQLNQNLSGQLSSLSPIAEAQLSPDEQLKLSRFNVTKTAIAKILSLNSSQVVNVNLQRVDLSPTPRESAKFTLVLNNVDLSGIQLQGANLYQANLRDSIFSGTGKDRHLGTFDDVIANLSGANLKEADLAGANLSYVLLNRANLMQVILNKADLSFAQLNQTNLSSVKLIGANLEGANLAKASLTGAELGESQFIKANLQGANLGRVRGVGASFSQANLSQSNWQGSDLSSVDFSKANLQQADLTSTQLKGANFRNVQLENANLSYTDLTQADLRGAKLGGANFQGVTFVVQKSSNSDQFLKTPSLSDLGAKIEGVDFNGVKNLSVSQLDFICTHGGVHSQCK